MPRNTHNSKESLRKARQPNRQPHLFGRGGRDRVLVCLAVNGPMHVRAIARAITTDSHKVFNMVERLCESGIVVKRNHEGGRKYASLNRKVPIYRSLHKLLLALDKHWPVERVERQVARWYMPFDDDMAPQRLDLIFQSPVRSRFLLLIAALRITDMTTIPYLRIGALLLKLVRSRNCRNAFIY